MSDPITTIDEAIGEINRRFEATLPRLADLDPKSFLASLWRQGAVVQDNPPAPLVFKACATDPDFVFSGNLTGQFIVYVTSGDDAPLTACVPTLDP